MRAWCAVSGRLVDPFVLPTFSSAGLVLANELGMRGVRVALFDVRQRPVHSRYSMLCAAACEGLSRLGVLEAMCARGTQTDVGWGASFADGMTHAGARVFCNTHAHSSGIAAALGSNGSRLMASRSMATVYAAQPSHRVMQSVQEAVLVDKARQYPSVQLHEAHEVLDLRVNAARDSVSVLVRSGTGLCVWHGRFLVGCDGARSRVASLLEVELCAWYHQLPFAHGACADTIRRICAAALNALSVLPCARSARSGAVCPWRRASI